jgi:hypothetical protein
VTRVTRADDEPGLQGRCSAPTDALEASPDSYGCSMTTIEARHERIATPKERRAAAAAARLAARKRESREQAWATAMESVLRGVSTLR